MSQGRKMLHLKIAAFYALVFFLLAASYLSRISLSGCSSLLQKQLLGVYIGLCGCEVDGNFVDASSERVYRPLLIARLISALISFSDFFFFLPSFREKVYKLLLLFFQLFLFWSLSNMLSNPRTVGVFSRCFSRELYVLGPNYGVLRFPSRKRCPWAWLSPPQR